MNVKIDELNIIASDFKEIALKVNELSKQRKQHAENVISMIKEVISIDNKLLKDFEDIFEMNVKQRINDVSVTSVCKILNLNGQAQLELFNMLESPDIDKELLAKVKEYIMKFICDVEELISNFESINYNDNLIALYESRLRELKSNQLKSIGILQSLADISYEESLRAIEGSSSNIDRGNLMIENYSKISSLNGEKKGEYIKNLLSEATKGKNIAEAVNKNSISQFQFAEKVKGFTEELYNVSNKVKELVNKKHSLFEESIQVATVATVGIAVKLKKYFEIEQYIEELLCRYPNIDELNDLIIYINIAIEEIQKLISLNYDMTDSSHHNNESETKTVETTDLEMELFNKIKSEVSAMTEATEYPIEGSSKNIENGKRLEVIFMESLNHMY